ncbi:MAG TPA: transposase, partial [Candidatus Ornithospirochaeta avicola]|nr:transposase [Candidatus Ornithospirochaeta avicola]
SKGWYDTRQLMRREYERLANRRRAKANQVYHDITAGRTVIVMQDENIKGWHKGLFGKQVQNSALGTLKGKLKSNKNVLVIDRFFPSTRMCPECELIHESITLSDRTFFCDRCGYSEDRDIKAAKTLLLAGKHKIACTLPEQKRTPVERKSAFDTSYEIWELSAKRPEKGKSPEAPSSKH